MDFLKLAEERYSVRKFEKRPVSKDDMDLILKAGYLAPTGCNLQPQRILVIEGEEALNKLRRCTKCHFDAPVALLVCYEKGGCWKRGYDGKLSGEIDASIVTTHMMLEAANIGVGSCWVMSYDPGAVRREFNVPDEYESTALLVMGYPAADAKPYPGHSEFKDMDELVFRGSF